MNIRSIHLSILISLLFSIVQNDVMAAAITDAVNDLPLEPPTNSSKDQQITSSDVYNLNGDPMLAGPQPPYPAQAQDSPGLESQMHPKPDFGYTTYNGTGKLQGKVAIITGGDSGIGRAVALAFSREGASIVISYLNETEDAEEIQRIIQQEGHNCTLVPGDITDETQCQKIVNTTVSTYGRIDILVNNAAYQGKRLNNSVEDMSHDRVLYTFKTNIVAMFDLTRLTIPYMPAGGSIINVASMQAYQPSPEILDYAATKAAIVGFTKGLAGKLLEKGIRVNAVAPGPIWTPLIVQSYSAQEATQHGAKSPMKRAGQPRELAPAFVYLASNKDSSYVSGEILGVTGGSILA